MTEYFASRNHILFLQSKGIGTPGALDPENESHFKTFPCWKCGVMLRRSGHFAPRQRPTCYSCKLTVKDETRIKREAPCKECGKTVVCMGSKPNFKSLGAVRENRVYCSEVCRDLWVKKNSGRVCGEKIAAYNRIHASARMKARNPMSIPGVREKIGSKLRGRTFIGRGGNGDITGHQKMLSEALGNLPMEVPIATAEVKDSFECLPASYKVDIADVSVKLAIEVDGATHRERRWRYLDRRKTEVLNSLGWTVLRFWNQEVERDLAKCVLMVTSTILRLKETTTTSPTAS